MSTITTIQSSDVIADSRSTINTNFSNLNTDKVERTAFSGHITAVAGTHGITGSFVGSTDTQTLTNKTLTSPVATGGTFSAPVITGTIAGSAALTTMGISGTYNRIDIREQELIFNDVTTGNASTTKHGLLPKLSNISTQFLDGTGSFTTPGGLVGTCGRTTQGASTGNNVITHGLNTTPKLIRVRTICDAAFTTDQVGWSEGSANSTANQQAMSWTMEASPVGMFYSTSTSNIVYIRNSLASDIVVAALTGISGTSFTINFSTAGVGTILHWEAIG